MQTLPIHEVLAELRTALATHACAVLQAPPGAGKTTVVPLSLLDEPWLNGRSILMLEPRRLAARAAAARMAQLHGDAVGETIGYRIRFESKVCARTRVEVLTEGILTRRLQQDPALDGVGLVIFDEYHERHWHADLALALCLDSQQGLREDLKILVMSATLDGEGVAHLLGDAPRITSTGRSFPVQVSYLPREPEGNLPNIVSQHVRTALETEPGDVLVFLPGAREIRSTQNLLQAALPTAEVEVHALYGDLPWEIQDRALQPAASGQRKVVLATPIAETSLTIEGIRVVVDAGYARVPQFDARSGLTRLVTQRISRASAEQRAGRAGRLAPGHCYRLWSESTQRGLIPQSLPEIRTADLAPLLLELAHWGVHDPDDLRWLDPPPRGALAQARELLQRLQALDAEGRITALGKRMAALPLHPRLAHMLCSVQDTPLAAAACDVAALLSERDILVAQQQRSCDIMERLVLLHSFRRDGRQVVRSRGADANACARVEQAVNQWQRLLRLRQPQETPTAEDIGRLLALAYPDRIAMQRAVNDPRYLMANGRGARLPEWEHALRQPCLVIADVEAGEAEGRIYLAAAVSLEQLRPQLASQLSQHRVVSWDSTQEVVLARQEERLGELVLSSKPLKDADPEALRQAMLEGVRRLGVDALPWTPEARAWQARVLSLRHWFPEENWPEVSDASLLNHLETWLGPFLDGITRRDHLARLDLLASLRAGLSWEQQQRLEQAAPTHLTVPSGSRVRLDYIPGQPPVLAVKLQELFGLTTTPTVAGGKVPVLLHLLSPARRPIQVTQDLQGFWRTTYAEVKKELKGRYPKHPWPEDPTQAVPTARAKPRGK